VNNQKILDNAPEGATHWDGSQYYRYHKDNWFSFHGFEWIDANEDELYTACSIRSLADIKHIVELEQVEPAMDRLMEEKRKRIAELTSAVIYAIDTCCLDEEHEMILVDVLAKGGAE
jgi:hypothetical protein